MERFKFIDQCRIVVMFLGDQTFSNCIFWHDVYDKMGIQGISKHHIEGSTE
jgi:hypothetical protein